MMVAGAVHFHATSVQFEAVTRSKLKGAETKNLINDIHSLSINLHAHTRHIAVRGCEIPALGLGHRGSQIKCGCRTCSNRLFNNRRCRHFFACRSIGSSLKNVSFNRHFRLLSAFVVHRDSQLGLCARVGHSRRCHVDTPVPDMDRRCLDKPYIPVNTSARIPA